MCISKINTIHILLTFKQLNNCTPKNKMADFKADMRKMEYTTGSPKNFLQEAHTFFCAIMGP